MIFVSGSEVCPSSKNEHESGVELSSTNAVEATRLSTSALPQKQPSCQGSTHADSPGFHRNGKPICGPYSLQKGLDFCCKQSVSVACDNGRLALSGITAEFPTQRNREFSNAYQGISFMSNAQSGMVEMLLRVNCGSNFQVGRSFACTSGAGGTTGVDEMFMAPTGKRPVLECPFRNSSPS